MHSVRFELICNGLAVKLANHCTSRERGGISFHRQKNVVVRWYFPLENSSSLTGSVIWLGHGGVTYCVKLEYLGAALPSPGRIEFQSFSSLRRTIGFILFPMVLVLCERQIGGSTRGVVATGLDCDIIVSEFKPQSRYYVLFWTNTLKKGMNLLILPAIVALLFFYKDGFGIKLPTKVGWYVVKQKKQRKQKKNIYIQTAYIKIWTRVSESTLFDDNRFTFSWII